MIYLRDYLNKNDIMKSINLSGNKLMYRGGVKVLTFKFHQFFFGFPSK